MSAADNNRGGNKAVLPPWMLTFADLMSLLLTFFVLLFSMSQIKVESWQAVVESLSQQRDPFSSAAESRPDADRNMPKEIEPRTYDLGYLETVIGEKLRSDPVLANSIVQRIGNRLIVSLSSDMLFDDNDAKLTQPAKQATFVLGNVLRTVGNAIEVDGHTDPKPVVGRSSYPSQWELTLSRAASVAAALRAAGYSRPIAAYGYADSRFSDIATNLSFARRYRLARRVDVVIAAHMAEKED